MSDTLTTRALTTAAELLNAAAAGDRWTMRRILTSLNPPPRGQIADILRAVAEAHYVDPTRILGHDRRTEAVAARQAVCYIAVTLFGHGYAQTGRDLDRDHTTVINAVRRVSADASRRRHAEEIAERLGWVRAVAS